MKKKRAKLKYKLVDTSTLEGLKQAERLHLKGWKGIRTGLFLITFESPRTNAPRARWSNQKAVTRPRRAPLAGSFTSPQNLPMLNPRKGLTWQIFAKNSWTALHGPHQFYIYYNDGAYYVRLGRVNSDSAPTLAGGPFDTIKKAKHYAQLLVKPKRSNPSRKNPLSDSEAQSWLKTGYSYLDAAQDRKWTKRQQEYWAGKATAAGEVVWQFSDSKEMTDKGIELTRMGNALTTQHGTFRGLKNPSRKNPARKNPVGRKIGRAVTRIVTTGGVLNPKGTCPIYGNKDGSVSIKGFFTNVPKGTVKEIWYMDEAKAKAEGFKNVNIPWKHDFTKERVPLQKTRGGW